MSRQFACCIYLPREQSVKELATKARAPTEGPEPQEIINKGQKAYRRTRASRNYQQRPEGLPKDQSIKKLSAKARSAKLERTTNDRHDGNQTRIGCSYTIAVPMNIGSHREVGDPTVEIDKATKRRANETPYQNARSKPQDDMRRRNYDT